MVGFLTLPFRVVGSLLGWVLNLVGRFTAILIGLLGVFVGILLTITVIGGIIRIPLLVFGFMLVLRGLF